MPSGTTIYDCSVKKLEKLETQFGYLSALRSFDNIPFSIKRIYYLYDVPSGAERGAHGHKELEQYFVAISGNFTVLLNDGEKEKSFLLNCPNEALYVAPGLWRQLIDFSSGAVCLVLASKDFSEKDYIRDYKEFLEYKKNKYV